MNSSKLQPRTSGERNQNQNQNQNRIGRRTSPSMMGSRPVAGPTEKVIMMDEEVASDQRQALKRGVGRRQRAPS